MPGGGPALEQHGERAVLAAFSDQQRRLARPAHAAVSLGPGSSAWRPSSAATQPRLMGHTVQAGRRARAYRRPQIHDGLRVGGDLRGCGVQASACAHSAARTEA